VRGIKDIMTPNEVLKIKRREAINAFEVGLLYID